MTPSLNSNVISLKCGWEIVEMIQCLYVGLHLGTLVLALILAIAEFDYTRHQCSDWLADRWCKGPFQHPILRISRVSLSKGSEYGDCSFGRVATTIWGVVLLCSTLTKLPTSSNRFGNFKFLHFLLIKKKHYWKNPLCWILLIDTSLNLQHGWCWHCRWSLHKFFQTRRIHAVCSRFHG